MNLAEKLIEKEIYRLENDVIPTLDEKIRTSSDNYDLYMGKVLNKVILLKQRDPKIVDEFIRKEIENKIAIINFLIESKKKEEKEWDELLDYSVNLAYKDK